MPATCILTISRIVQSLGYIGKQRRLAPIVSAQPLLIIIGRIQAKSPLKTIRTLLNSSCDLRISFRVQLTALKQKQCYIRTLSYIIRKARFIIAALCVFFIILQVDQLLILSRILNQECAIQLLLRSRAIILEEATHNTTLPCPYRYAERAQYRKVFPILLGPYIKKAVLRLSQIAIVILLKHIAYLVLNYCQASLYAACYSSALQFNSIYRSRFLAEADQLQQGFRRANCYIDFP